MLWHPKLNCSYVSSVDLPSDSLRKNLAWWVVTRRTSKNHKTVKIGGWTLAWVWAFARDNMVTAIKYPPSSFYLSVNCHCILYTCRIALLFNKPGLPLIQARTGSWLEGWRTVGTPSWSSPGTGSLVMTETETLRYCDTTAQQEKPILYRLLGKESTQDS